MLLLINASLKQLHMKRREREDGETVGQEKNKVTIIICDLWPNLFSVLEKVTFKSNALQYSLKKLLFTLISYFLWKIMHYVTFVLLFKYEQGVIVCF